jgi:signal peptidase I
MSKSKEQPLKEQSAGQVAWEWIKSGIIGFLIFLVVRTFLIQTFTIVSGSMENTLLIGDFLVLNKSAYGATVPVLGKRLPGYDTPDRGDIIVFAGHHEEEPIDLVKRLVGMPGDTLRMRDGELFINSQPAPDDFVRHTDPGGDGGHPWMDWQASFLTDSAAAEPYYPTRDNWGPVVVPEARYFVLGDNRDESLDSRYWGFIQGSQIKGRAVALYFSYDTRSDGGGIPIVSRIRWSRIGDRLK